VIERLELTIDAGKIPNYDADFSGSSEVALLIERDDRTWRA